MRGPNGGALSARPPPPTDVQEMLGLAANLALFLASAAMMAV
ncbi:MAG: hypothetical protein AAF909_00220 [Pseudomonadota bacterium]